MAKLFWLQPDSTIVEFPLKGEQNLIGRSSRCDVRIKHPGISSEHALIRVLPGSATVEDLKSTNGTRVNGRRVELHTLRHGDQIGVGRERLMYFAELDEAARFLQPESIEPFAQPAPLGERVNTQDLDPSATAATPASHIVIPETGDGSMPELDPALLASLPRGASLPNASGPRAAPAVARKDATGASATATAAAAATTTATPVAAPAAAAKPAQVTAASGAARLLSASVAVLSGPAAGKRYPLEQSSVTLGKEGKQVVEFLRAGPTRWQIKQREGVTPAYINGDALSGVRELAAGDVVELTGVRLRFEINLSA